MVARCLNETNKEGYVEGVSMHHEHFDVRSIHELQAERKGVVIMPFVWQLILSDIYPRLEVASMELMDMYLIRASVNH